MSGMPSNESIEGRAARDLLARYWARHYVINGICGLCMNSGSLHLINGSRQPCICPQGRVLAERMERGG